MLFTYFIYYIIVEPFLYGLDTKKILRYLPKKGISQEDKKIQSIIHFEYEKPSADCAREVVGNVMQEYNLTL